MELFPQTLHHFCIKVQMQDKYGTGCSFKTCPIKYLNIFCQHTPQTYVFSFQELDILINIGIKLVANAHFP